MKDLAGGNSNVTSHELKVIGTAEQGLEHDAMSASSKIVTLLTLAEEQLQFLVRTRTNTLFSLT